MKERASRVIDTCRQIARMTEEPGRITRRFLTPPVRDVHALLSQRMRTLDMQVHVDAIGNLRGLWMPANADGKRLVLGSHIDTVPDAGAFDGVLGVVLALEWVATAREQNLRTPLEVIAFSEEEGVRFDVPFLGSRAVAGTFDPALLDLRDRDGLSVRDAITAFGLDPDAIGEARLAQDALGFVEVHIEQGPVLEAEQLSVAAVSAIVGQTRGVLRFHGEASHAGTTPINLRRDALAAAAEWISVVERTALNTPGLTATVGKIEVTPNAANVIAGRASVTLDCRHESDAARHTAVSELLNHATQIAQRRGIAVECDQQMNQASVPLDPNLTACMTQAVEYAGCSPRLMTSGAGHDAMVMASCIPAAMLFVRSPGGISHHPSESVRAEDVEAALHVGENFLKLIEAAIR